MNDAVTVTGLTVVIVLVTGLLWIIIRTRRP